MKPSSKQFQKIILDHYSEHGRVLPWRKTSDPYAIVVSEIMLQQTQAERVVPKYEKFLANFPTFAALAIAPLPTVLKAWQGLGYNRRAINLQRLAKEVAEKYNGVLPDDPELVDELPGIGKATAGSIVTYSYNKVAPFIETNVRAVYIHFFFPNRDDVHDNELWPIVAKTVDTTNPRRWYNALMDYGVKLKKEHRNPSRKSKHHIRQSKFEGSNRQLRGKIVKLLLENPEFSSDEVSIALDAPFELVEKNMIQLAKEGFTIVS